MGTCLQWVDDGTIARSMIVQGYIIPTSSSSTSTPSSTTTTITSSTSSSMTSRFIKTTYLTPDCSGIPWNVVYMVSNDLTAGCVGVESSVYATVTIATSESHVDRNIIYHTPITPSHHHTRCYDTKFKIPPSFRISSLPPPPLTPPPTLINGT